MTSDEPPFADIEATPTAAGMRVEDPPEEWHVKAWDDDVLVDLIFWPKGLPIDDDAPQAGARPEARVRVVTNAGSTAGGEE